MHRCRYHHDSSIDDSDGDDSGRILVLVLADGLKKKNITISIIQRWERRSDYRRMPLPPPMTTKMTTRGKDCCHGRRRRNIVAVELLFHLGSDSTARPFNISFFPDPTACHHCLYTTIGADINTGPRLPPRPTNLMLKAFSTLSLPMPMT